MVTLRKKRNWSQQFVADKLGLSNRTICKWETGRWLCNAMFCYNYQNIN
ncbi:MAG: helix-turn-helix transcriptional regulator [Synergistaceae bacterium]|nr:helix-turn-helix transcriptional regulator [Synergistaceae bacterium]